MSAIYISGVSFSTNSDLKIAEKPKRNKRVKRETIFLCPKCSRVWEKHLAYKHGKATTRVAYYGGFPKIGLSKIICEGCSAE